MAAPDNMNYGKYFEDLDYGLVGRVPGPLN
jgi:hypothetical protein